MGKARRFSASPPPYKDGYRYSETLKAVGEGRDITNAPSSASEVFIRVKKL
jgi:hypothetical protein